MALRTVGTVGTPEPIEEICVALRIFLAKRVRQIFFPHEPQHEVSTGIELIRHRLLGLGVEGGQARRISLRLPRELNRDAGEVPGTLLPC